MGPWLIYTITGLQLLVSIDLMRQGKVGLSIVFFSYVICSIGLLIASQEVP